jgi:hypothetical protein
MILKALAGLSLVITVSIDTHVKDPLGGIEPAAQMSMQQRNAAVRPLVRSATECVARSVSSDPRFGQQVARGDINDLIVESMPSCVDPMRAMIDAYDRFFGTGSGESFFAGPYLDVLPAAVHKLLERNGTERRSSSPTE